MTPITTPHNEPSVSALLDEAAARAVRDDVDREPFDGVLDVDVRRLAPGSLVVVETRNSTYRLRMIDPERQTALVQGGHALAGAIEARVVGASFGGSWLGIAQICVGLSLELFVSGQRVVTSTVRAITLPSSASWRRPSRSRHLGVLNHLDAALARHDASDHVDKLTKTAGLSDERGHARNRRAPAVRAIGPHERRQDDHRHLRIFASALVDERPRVVGQGQQLEDQDSRTIPGEPHPSPGARDVVERQRRVALLRQDGHVHLATELRRVNDHHVRPVRPGVQGFRVHQRPPTARFHARGRRRHMRPWPRVKRRRESQRERTRREALRVRVWTTMHQTQFIPIQAIERVPV
jgi:hypothetical protein